MSFDVILLSIVLPTNYYLSINKGLVLNVTKINKEKKNYSLIK